MDCLCEVANVGAWRYDVPGASYHGERVSEELWTQIDEIDSDLNGERGVLRLGDAVYNVRRSRLLHVPLQSTAPGFNFRA